MNNTRELILNNKISIFQTFFPDIKFLDLLNVGQVRRFDQKWRSSEKCENKSEFFIIFYKCIDMFIFDFWRGRKSTDFEHLSENSARLDWIWGKQIA